MGFKAGFKVYFFVHDLYFCWRVDFICIEMSSTTRIIFFEVCFSFGMYDKKYYNNKCNEIHRRTTKTLFISVINCSLHVKRDPKIWWFIFSYLAFIKTCKKVLFWRKFCKFSQMSWKTEQGQVLIIIHAVAVILTDIYFLKNMTLMEILNR